MNKITKPKVVPEAPKMRLLDAAQGNEGKPEILTGPPAKSEMKRLMKEILH